MEPSGPSSGRLRGSLRRWLFVAAVAASSAVIAGQAPGVSAAAQGARPDVVVIVAIPSVSVDDLAGPRVPTLTKLARDWSVGGMAIPTFDAPADLATTYTSLGAGRKARGQDPDDPDQALRTSGSIGGELTVVGWHQVVDDNLGLTHGAVPGLLGTAIEGAGLSTAVIGNADGSGFVKLGEDEPADLEFMERRWAAMALANSAGKVDSGAVDGQVTIRDDSTASGFRTNGDAIEKSFAGALTKADVILVELADVYREGQVIFPPRDVEQEHPDPAGFRDAALAREDANLARLLNHVDLEKDSLFVISTSGIGPGERERLVVAIQAGVGAEEAGLLTSPTTLRPGIVTLSDVPPSILDLYGQEIPEGMDGRPMESIDGTPQRLEELSDIQAKALFHLEWRGPYFGSFAGVQLALYGLVAAALISRRRIWIRSTRLALLAFLAIPGATYLWHAVSPEEMSPPVAVTTLIALAVALAAIAHLPSRGRTTIGPPALICALTFLIIAVDLLTGAGLQISTLVGYSPIFAARFFGIGNLSFAIFGTAAILGLALVGRMEMRMAMITVTVIAGFTIFLIGSPSLGADFGGLLASAFAFGVIGLTLLDVRLDFKRLALLALAAVALGLLVGFIDWLRDPASQTHIGRFFGQLLQGDLSTVTETLRRKAAANVAIAQRNYFSFLVPIIGLAVLLVFRSPRGLLRKVISETPVFKTVVVGAVAMNLAGFVLNDSGIVIPAMGLAMIVPFILITVLGTAGETEGPFADPAPAGALDV